MALTRTNVSGTNHTYSLTSTLNTGNLAATLLELGSTIAPGKYLVGVYIKINANVATATITAVTIDSKNVMIGVVAAPSLNGAVAAGTVYQMCGLTDITVAAPTIATTTANAPQYDITVTLTYVGA